MAYYDYEEKSPVVVSSGGVGFCSLLTIVFVVLKLCKVISWNWFWVLSPTIFAAGLWILFVIFVIIATIIINRA